MRNTLFCLLFTFFLSACQTYPLMQQQAMNTSIVQEVKVVPMITDTSQVIFSGIVTEVETDDPVLFGSVAIYQGDRLIKVTETDFDGRFFYQLPQVQDTLAYLLEFSYLGMNSLRIENVRLAPRDSSYFAVKLGKDHRSGDLLDGPYCPSFRVPLIEQDNTTSGQTFTSDQIRRNATRGM